MIQSFKDNDTRRYFEGVRIARFYPFAAQAIRRLTVLDSSAALHDVAVLRSNHLEAMRDDRAGQYSVRVNAQWRICFRWTDDGPRDAEIVDYH